MPPAPMAPDTSYGPSFVPLVRTILEWLILIAHREQWLAARRYFREAAPKHTIEDEAIEIHFGHCCLSRLPKYTLTRICDVEYIQDMESVLEIIADATGGAISNHLVSSRKPG